MSFYNNSNFNRIPEAPARQAFHRSTVPYRFGAKSRTESGLSIVCFYFHSYKIKDANCLDENVVEMIEAGTLLQQNC